MALRYYRLWTVGTTGGLAVLPVEAPVIRFAHCYRLIFPPSFENLCTYLFPPLLLLSQMQVQVAPGELVGQVLPSPNVPVPPTPQMFSSGTKLRTELMKMQGSSLQSRAHPEQGLANPNPMPPRSLHITTSLRRNGPRGHMWSRDKDNKTIM